MIGTNHRTERSLRGYDCLPHRNHTPTSTGDDGRHTTSSAKRKTDKVGIRGYTPNGKEL